MAKAKQEDLPEEIKALSFEQAMAELEDIVRQLEGGSVELEESIEIYTRGQQLKAHCEAKLKDAQTRIEKIVVSSGGEIAAEPTSLD